MQINKIYHGDCFNILNLFPDNSVDAIITDPPYGINLSHWDKPVDITLFTSQVKRISTDFYVFFGQMPTVITWINACHDLHYLEHISWVKRIATPCTRLSKSHENIYIYTKNKKNFYCNKANYTDIKLPCVLVDVTTIKAIDRYINDLHSKLKGTFKERTINISHQKEFDQKFKRFKKSSDRSPEKVNFTNVWSFLPTTQAKRRNAIKHQHPCQKPVEIMKRLIEMCSPPGGTILDPFGGSGSTAIAALETGRNYIVIERELEYYNMINERIADWHSQLKKENFSS